MNELVKWRLDIEDIGKLDRLVGESIFREVRRISAEGDNYKRIEKLNRLFPLLTKFNLNPSLYKSQNLYFEISLRDRTFKGHSDEWIKQFTLLGDHLGVKLD
jgi:hypothetical protein